MRIEHIALYVQDLAAAKAFFATYLGGTPGEGYNNPHTGLRTYFITFEGGARLELMTRPALAEGVDNQPRAGYAHLAFALGSRQAVDALTQRLQADGYTVTSGPRVTGDGYYESCVLGPEGCTLEFTE